MVAVCFRWGSTLNRTMQPHKTWAMAEGCMSPHHGIGLDMYPDELTHLQAEILANAEVVCFDASNIMPGVVGTGTA